MKKRRVLLLLLSLTLFIACDNSKVKQNKAHLIPISVENDYNVDLYFAKRSWSEKADSLFLRFRVADKNNKKITWFDLKKENFEIREEGGNPPNREIILERIVQSADKTVAKADNISQQVVCWFMVDRSKTIAKTDLDNMKSAIQKTIENLPDGSAYISFFDNQITERKLITSSNFQEFENEFRVSNSAKNLYQSIYQNFMLFVNDAQKKDAAKYLLIFTDGKIDANAYSEVSELFKYADLIKEIDNNIDNNVRIHAFRYGDFPLADQALLSICKQHRKPELQGGFYPAHNVAGIVDSLRGFIDNITADYELTLINNVGKIYNGTDLALQIIIEKNAQKAVGNLKYAIGSKEKVIVAGKTSDDILLAIILGLVVMFIAFFIMQVIIPYIIHRRTNFEKKYVRPYESNDEDIVYEVCSYCQEPLEQGELIVVKCPHKIHWDCWKENGYKCVEYGQNCKEGVQFHFDKEHPFDLKKSPFYLKWAMSGMIGGFFIWILFYLSSKLTLFPNLIKCLLNTFYPTRLKEEIEGVLQISNVAQTTFQSKIAGLLMVGILLGFVLTFLFSYINDFRKKTTRVIFAIFLRASIGALLGFVAFILGSILCIVLGKYSNVWWLDAIPWLLLGGTIALCLVYKTTIKWQDALIGGLISGILSFFILYTTSFFPVFGVMFSIMLCSAGIGISIIARHQAAQKYFLKYKGERKEGIIAIHKWMNESGGSNEVSIGKSNHCVIQMNWDTNEAIHDKQVRLYIDPKRRVPMMKILENGVVFDKRDARKDDVVPLRHGVKFNIGNTEFEYIEK